MAEPRVRQTSPPESGGPSGDKASGRKASAPGSRSRPRRDKLAGVEDKLNELMATVAMGQQALALATDDPRHGRGAVITNQLAPPMVHSWVELARENPAVERVLLRLTEGSAWGGVIMTSVGFVYSQAQAYEVLPEGFPNPWARGDEFVPPSDEHNVTAAAAGFGVDEGDIRSAFDGGARPPKGPPQSGVDEPLNEAERQRAEVERRRKERGS